MLHFYNYFLSKFNSFIEHSENWMDTRDAYNSKNLIKMLKAEAKKNDT